jgi:thioredoxin-like negative regulator of GroEL
MTTSITSTVELLQLLEKYQCIVIKFSASWCKPCKNKNFLEAYYKLKNEFNSYHNVLFLELDIDEHETIIEQFKISAVPTIKVFSFRKQFSEYTGIDELNKVKTDILNIIGM